MSISPQVRETGMRDLTRPGPAARRMIDSLNRLRAAVLGRRETW